MNRRAHHIVLAGLCLLLMGLPVVARGMPADSLPGLTGARWHDAPARPHTVIGENYWKPNGTAISEAGGVLGTPAITTDGASGAILVWSDCRTADDCDIFAQRVGAEGMVQWAANGIPLATAPGNQVDPHIVADDAGGAIVAWTDDRSPAATAVFAQRVAADGSLLWASTGLTITHGLGDRVLGGLVADASGGAYVLWEQVSANDALNSDLFAQRLAADGALLWSTPVTITTAPGEQYGLQATADGSGGVIVTWGDLREPLDPNVYAQRITASGVALWTPNGEPVSVDPGRQSPPAQVVADGAGSALVVWQDFRLNTRRSDVFMQRMSATGQRAWADDRAVIASQGLSEAATALIADGAGGAIVLANALPEVVSDTDVLAQRVSPAGQLLWGDAPVNVTPWADRQLDAVGVADGLGGAYVAWTDQNSDFPTLDVWAQHLGADGAPLWAGHGVQAVALAQDQKNLAAVSDGQFGLIVGWQDGRNDPDSPDLYAQRVGDRIYRYALPLIRR